MFKNTTQVSPALESRPRPTCGQKRSFATTTPLFKTFSSLFRGFYRHSHFALTPGVMCFMELLVIS